MIHEKIIVWQTEGFCPCGNTLQSDGEESRNPKYKLVSTRTEMVSQYHHPANLMENN